MTPSTAEATTERMLDDGPQEAAFNIGCHPEKLILTCQGTPLERRELLQMTNSDCPLDWFVN